MKNPSEQWRDRLEAEGWKAEGWKAESLILLARLVAGMVEHAASGGLTPAGERMLSEHTPPIDWAKAYRAAPISLARIVTHVDPSITSLPPPMTNSLVPGYEPPWRKWPGSFGDWNTELIPPAACYWMKHCHRVRCSA